MPSASSRSGPLPSGSKRAGSRCAGAPPPGSSEGHLRSPHEHDVLHREDYTRLCMSSGIATSKPCSASARSAGRATHVICGSGRPFHTHSMSTPVASVPRNGLRAWRRGHRQRNRAGGLTQAFEGPTVAVGPSPDSSPSTRADRRAARQKYPPDDALWVPLPRCPGGVEQ
jgi:hypothetical protein